MNVAQLGEQELIRRMAEVLSSVANPATPTDVLVGIGDDAALVRWGNPFALLKSDQQVEGVHFDRSWAEPEDVGWKALVVNLSDVASMGGTPHSALVSLAVPAETEVSWVERFCSGLSEAASAYGVDVVGGDTSSSPVIVINVALTGTLSDRTGATGDPLLRSNGMVGDVVAVTGSFGGAGACLRLLTGTGDKRPTTGLMKALLKPVPRIPEGRVLREEGVRAAIDVSDGLLSDLGRLCGASGFSAVVDASAVPVHDDVHACFSLEETLEIALSGGEDYELLFTAPAEVVERVAARVETRVSVIGRLVPGPAGDVAVEGRDGVPVELSSIGWRHF